MSHPDEERTSAWMISVWQISVWRFYCRVSANNTATGSQLCVAVLQRANRSMTPYQTVLLTCSLHALWKPEDGFVRLFSPITGLRFRTRTTTS